MKASVALGPWQSVSRSPWCRVIKVPQLPTEAEQKHILWTSHGQTWILQEYELTTWDNPQTTEKFVLVVSNMTFEQRGLKASFATSYDFCVH